MNKRTIHASGLAFLLLAQAAIAIPAPDDTKAALPAKPSSIAERAAMDVENYRQRTLVDAQSRIDCVQKSTNKKAVSECFIGSTGAPDAALSVALGKQMDAIEQTSGDGFDAARQNLLDVLTARLSCAQKSVEMKTLLDCAAPPPGRSEPPSNK